MIYLLSLLTLPYLVADAVKRYHKQTVAESEKSVGKETNNVKDTH